MRNVINKNNIFFLTTVIILLIIYTSVSLVYMKNK